MSKVKSVVKWKLLAKIYECEKFRTISLSDCSLVWILSSLVPITLKFLLLIVRSGSELC